MIVIVAPTYVSYETRETRRSPPDEELKKELLLMRSLIGLSAPMLFLLLVLEGSEMLDANTLANVVIAGITVIAFALTGIGVVYSLRNQVANLTNSFIRIEDDIKRIRDIMVTQGQHSERITFIHATQINQGKRLDDLMRRFNTYLDLRLGDKSTLIESEDEE